MATRTWARTSLPRSCRAWPAEHSFSEVIEEIRRELVKGGQPRILLAGSIFGGTGASAIPSIARYIRNLTDENPNPDARRAVGGGAIIGAMLLAALLRHDKGRRRDRGLAV